MTLSWIICVILALAVIIEGFFLGVMIAKNIIQKIRIARLEDRVSRYYGNLYDPKG